MLGRQPVDGNQGTPYPSGGRTVLAYSLMDRLLIFIGMPALGMLLAYVLPVLARWAAGLPVVPLRIVLERVGSVDEPWEIAGCLAVGLLLGLGAAFVAVNQSMKVTLTDAELRLDKVDWNQTVARADVAAVFPDGRKLVVLDRQSRQLVSDTHRSSTAALAHGFRAHRYPWQDSDPYADLYQRWIPDSPDLPPAVNAALAARGAAVARKDARDILELRDAVQKYGYVVRDDGARQYWRPLVRS